MSADAQYRVAARMLAKRLSLLQKLMLHARERGDSTVELHLQELWDSEDQKALDFFAELEHEFNGARPLPFEVA